MAILCSAHSLLIKSYGDWNVFLIRMKDTFHHRCFQIVISNYLVIHNQKIHLQYIVEEKMGPL